MRPIHPGEVLREEFLTPLGLSANALALALQVSAPRINDIVRERRAITPDTALRLAAFFGPWPVPRWPTRWGASGALKRLMHIGRAPVAEPAGHCPARRLG